jgi:hypothetical protein
MDTRPNKWKRAFMSAERERRKLERIVDVELFDLELDAKLFKKEIRVLEFQTKRDKCTIQGQRQIISTLQKALRDNAITEPPGTHIASFKTCRAADEEICPLSLHPINKSPPPYDSSHAEIDIEPRKPHHKCAELHCGHRFNSLWLLYHFVDKNTFRCPVCRTGPVDFRFELEQLPMGLVERIRRMPSIRDQND